MSDWIDDASKSLGEVRNRPQMAQHVRTVEIQTLDALLRIEELLTQLIAVTASVPNIKFTEADAEDRGRSNYEGRVTPVTAKTTKKNSKYL